MTRPTGTLPLVDPSLADLLDPDPTVDLTPEMVPLMRAAERALPPHFRAEGAVELSYALAGDVPLHIYRPANAEGGCIYHIHGGGYVSGSAARMEPVHRWLADKLGCVIVSVDYRLAPEHPFPAGINDCYAGLAWTFAEAEALGVDTTRIGIMGESAGGGLAAALALMARDRGEYHLAFQHLIYPMLDDRTCARDPHPVTGEFIWTPHNNKFGWSALLGHEPGGEGVSPYAAPARAEDLAGLPPSFISTGSLDLFLDEDIDYARRLIRAGVPTKLHVYPGAVHAFDFFADGPLSQQAWIDGLRFLAKALNGKPREPKRIAGEGA